MSNTCKIVGKTRAWSLVKDRLMCTLGDQRCAYVSKADVIVWFRVGIIIYLSAYLSTQAGVVPCDTNNFHLPPFFLSPSSILLPTYTSWYYLLLPLSTSLTLPSFSLSFFSPFSLSISSLCSQNHGVGVSNTYRIFLPMTKVIVVWSMYSAIHCFPLHRNLTGRLQSQFSVRIIIIVDPKIYFLSLHNSPIKVVITNESKFKCPPHFVHSIRWFYLLHTLVDMITLGRSLLMYFQQTIIVNVQTMPQCLIWLDSPSGNTSRREGDPLSLWALITTRKSVFEKYFDFSVGARFSLHSMCVFLTVQLCIV